MVSSHVSDVGRGVLQLIYTVFTPVYNRAHTLRRVYRSLSEQTFRDFEWLIVDDGSTDETSSTVRRFIEENGRNSFPIRYLFKENGGKHTATNLGVAEARGDLFLTLDSDDECVPEALERLYYHWTTIPSNIRDGYSAVTALCKYPDGSIVGNRFPESPFDSDSIRSHEWFHISGEKWGFQRTDVMRQFPFPEFPGERFVPESLVWNRIALSYKTRYVNEALRIYHPEADSLSSSVVAIRVMSPRGSSLMYNELSAAKIPVYSKLKAVMNYLRFSIHAGTPLRQIVKNSAHSVLAVTMYPAAFLFYLKDRRSTNGSR